MGSRMLGAGVEGRMSLVIAPLLRSALALAIATLLLALSQVATLPRASAAGFCKVAWPNSVYSPLLLRSPPFCHGR